MIKLGAFAKNITGTFLLNVGEALFAFLTAILLTRLMGSASFGIYSYIISLVGLLSTLTLLGQDKLIVKELASKTKEINSRLLFNSSLVVVATLYSALMILFFFYMNYTIIEPARHSALILLPVLLFLTVASKILEALLQGHNFVAKSFFAMKFLKPLCFISLIGAVTFIDITMSAANSISLTIFATIIALVYLSRFICDKAILSKAPPSETLDNMNVVKKGVPFALIASISAINGNIDMIMLAQYVSDEQLGIYRVVHRVTSLTAFALTAVNAVFGPRISAFYAEQNFSEMQRLAVISATAVAAIAIPTSAILIFQGNLVLLVFGQEFVQGDVTLKIMVIGQLVNVFTGSVGLILAMTSYARKVSTSLALACIANVVVNLLLIPVMGINGAALATVASVAMVNLINLYWVITKLKINPTIFGVFKLRSDVKI